MVYASEDDTYCYPGTRVLKNRLGLSDPLLLEEAELALTLLRAEEGLPPGRLDKAHYLALHRHLFQDVYDWAGEVRRVRIGKAGNWFCYPEYISRELEALFDSADTPSRLLKLGHAGFCAGATRFLSELNAIHPFRDGNGRTQMTFIALVAEQGGFGFDAEAIEPKAAVQAMIESFSGNSEALQALLHRIITPRT